jgi:hypothetical protein
LDPFTGAIAQGCLRSSGNREEHILIALVRAVFRRESRLRFGDKTVEGVARHVDNGIAGQAAALDLQEPSPLTWACDALADRDGGVQRQGWPRPFGASCLPLPFLGVRRGEERRGARRRAMPERRAAAGRDPDIRRA